MHTFELLNERNVDPNLIHISKILFGNLRQFNLG